MNIKSKNILISVLSVTSAFLFCLQIRNANQIKRLREPAVLNIGEITEGLKKREGDLNSQKNDIEKRKAELDSFAIWASDKAGSLADREKKVEAREEAVEAREKRVKGALIILARREEGAASSSVSPKKSQEVAETQPAEKPIQNAQETDDEVRKKRLKRFEQETNNP